MFWIINLKNIFGQQLKFDQTVKVFQKVLLGKKILFLLLKNYFCFYSRMFFFPSKSLTKDLNLNKKNYFWPKNSFGKKKKIWPNKLLKLYYFNCLWKSTWCIVERSFDSRKVCWHENRIWIMHFLSSFFVLMIVKNMSNFEKKWSMSNCNLNRRKSLYKNILCLIY